MNPFVAWRVNYKRNKFLLLSVGEELNECVFFVWLILHLVVQFGYALYSFRYILVLQFMPFEAAVNAVLRPLT